MDPEPIPTPVHQSSRDWKCHFTTVTPLSKFLAMLLFIAMPFAGFGLGLKYGGKMNSGTQVTIEKSSTIPATSLLQVDTVPSATTTTYVNKEYGFSFTYPAYWTVSNLKRGDFNNSSLVFSIEFSYPFNEGMRNVEVCELNRRENWMNASPTPEECEPLLANLTVNEKIKLNELFTQPSNIFVRVYKADTPLREWLIHQYKISGSELEDYSPGTEIVLDGERGFLSSIGCCGGIDDSYVVRHGGYIYEFGTNSDRSVELLAKDFHFLASSSGITYELTPNGELIRFDNGQPTKLVMMGRDMSTSSIEYSPTYDGNNIEIYPYTKGRVLQYYVSPNGEHVAYIIQSGIGGCCMSPPKQPIESLMIMKSDGSNKIQIDSTPHNGSRIIPAGWIADSSYFVFADQHFDEATQGSYFYRAHPGDREIELFAGMEQSEDPYAITIANGLPYFSPSDPFMVYRNGGYWGTDILWSLVSGEDKKVILKVESSGTVDISWSPDGEQFYVHRDNVGTSTFSKTGDPIAP